MPEEKKKNWFRKHWFLTGMGILILFVIISVAIGSNNPSSSNSKIGSNNLSSSNSNLQEKTSGYTVNECLDICEQAYNIELQVSSCQTSCWTIGNSGSSMDKYVNKVKDIRDKKG